MEEININNKIYRRYIDRYYISNDGVMVSVEFDKNNNIKLLRTMKADTSNYGHKRIEIKINTQIKNTYFNKENVNKKMMVIDVECFSFTEDYVCPHYYDSLSSDKELREETWKDHCRKCWNV